MALSKERTQEIIKAFGKNENDSGSTEVQIALMSAQIADLTEHLKIHTHDNHSRRGLLVLVGKRRGLLDYLKANNEQKYVELIEKLKLRK